MTREEQVLQEYENKLNDLYAHANTKSKKKKIAYDLINFSAMCYEHFGIEKTFDWEHDKEIYQFQFDLLEPFLIYTKDYHSDYLAISDSVLVRFLETEFPFYKDYGKLVYTIPQIRQKEIISDFLSSYDPKLFNLYREKLRNSEIFKTDLFFTLGYGGLHYHFDGLRRGLIFCEKRGNSVSSLGTLVHELGHAYENDIIYSVGISNPSIIRNKLPYTEVCARFLEYSFYNYLTENRIYQDDVIMTLRSYYKRMLCYMYEINLVCKMEHISVNRYGYVEIGEASIAYYANTLKRLLNYYNLPSELGEEIHYRYAFTYGLSNLIAIHLYDKYKDNPTTFKKEFNNCVINYLTEGLEAFERVGVTKELLTSNKTLRKRLKDI